MSTLAAVIALAAIVGWKIYTRPVAAQRRLAPEGTYFLTEYVSFPTQHGLIGVEPGEMVHLLRKLDAAGKWLHVAGRDGEFDVSADQLTDDLDLAEAIRRQDQVAQEDARATSVKLDQEQTEQRQAYDDSRAKAVQQNNVAVAASSGVGGYNSRLHEPATRGGTYVSSYYYLPTSPAGNPSAPGAGGGSAASGSSGAQSGASGGGARNASTGINKYTMGSTARPQRQGSPAPPTFVPASR